MLLLVELDLWWRTGLWVGAALPADTSIQAAPTVGGLPAPAANYPLMLTPRSDSTVEVVGPTYYAPVSGTPPSAGGEAVPAGVFGMTWVEALDLGAATSNDGLYSIQIAYGGPLPISQSVALKWIVAATSAEVAVGTNLSASRVRLRATGR